MKPVSIARVLQWREYAAIQWRTHYSTVKQLDKGNSMSIQNMQMYINT